MGLMQFVIITSMDIQESECPIVADDIDTKIKALISQMTIQEKIGQLQQYSYSEKTLDTQTLNLIKNGQVGSFLNLANVDVANEVQTVSMTQSRLKIPLLNGKDVIHGFKTIFPIPLGQAATFNPDIVEQAARVASVEGSADGVRWTFSPMLDIARDHRWGRIAEGCGQDTYLCSKMGIAMVQGYQLRDLTQGKQPGDLKDITSMAACAKHYIGYGVSEGGRDYNTTNIPQNLLRDVYLPPFRETIRQNCLTVMSAFNCLNGVPASGNQWTIKQILKKELGFKGLVVSDWLSIRELIVHGYAEDQKDAALKGFSAGVDMEMVTECYKDNLEKLISEGKVSLADLETSVGNVLRVKFKLGLFENYYTDPARQKEILSQKNKQVAKSVALQSAILLKNSNNRLPLNKNTLKSLAVIGPLADDGDNQIGCWNCEGDGKDSITTLTAIKDSLTSTTINYAKGLPDARSTDTGLFKEALSAAEASDVVLLVLGEDNLLSGEANCRTELGLPGAQEELIDQVYKLGKPIVLVIYAGRPLVLTKILPKVQALLYTFHLGTMAGPAIVDLLLGVKSPSGRLPLSFLKAQGQLPIYYNRFNTGRPDLQNYIEMDSNPLFPFGFGLTYTKFSYSNIRLSKQELRFGDSLLISLTVKNQGTVPAEEVVMFFVRDHVGSYTRPVKELKGFKKIALTPGQNTSVLFILNSSDLAFWTAKQIYTAEAGKFTCWIGPNASEGLSADFTLKG